MALADARGAVPLVGLRSVAFIDMPCAVQREVALAYLLEEEAGHRTSVSSVVGRNLGLVGWLARPRPYQALYIVLRD